MATKSTVELLMFFSSQSYYAAPRKIYPEGRRNRLECQYRLTSRIVVRTFFFSVHILHVLKGANMDKGLDWLVERAVHRISITGQSDTITLVSTSTYTSASALSQALIAYRFH
jgi:hypothetical protein